MADSPHAGTEPRGGEDEAARTFVTGEPATRIRPGDAVLPLAGPDRPVSATGGEATRTFAGGDAVTSPRSGDRAGSRLRPAAVAAEPGPPAQEIRYGPGVPGRSGVSQAAGQAEQVWRTGAAPAPARRRPRLPRLLSAAVTVILLAASGAVLYLRFHHAALHLTSVVITEPRRIACGGQVTARLATNGAAGTVAYQWLIQPPQPGEKEPGQLSATTIAGQHVLYLTQPIDARGPGRAAQVAVTLRVLGPDVRSASASVVISC